MPDHKITPFNSALETGVRALTILAAAYPRGHDLHRLVQYDYLTVHSSDAYGPPSLHPAVPQRSNELLIRRHIVQRGLMLMMSARFIGRRLTDDGVIYVAKDEAGGFLSNLRSGYQLAVEERAQWVVNRFDDLGEAELGEVMRSLFQAWTAEFQRADTMIEPDGWDE